jgi:hypothetical protein
MHPSREANFGERVCVFTSLHGLQMAIGAAPRKTPVTIPSEGDAISENGTIILFISPHPHTYNGNLMNGPL